MWVYTLREPIDKTRCTPLWCRISLHFTKLFGSKASGSFRLSVCYSTPHTIKRTRFLFSEAILQHRISCKYGLWSFFCISWVVSCCTTLLSQPYSQSYRITQSPLPFSPTIPSYLSHSTNWGCIKDLSAALVLIYFSFRETLAGITALTITDSLLLRIRKLVYIK